MSGLPSLAVSVLIIVVCLAASSQGLPRVLVSPDTSVADAGSTLLLPCVAYTILPNNTSPNNHPLVMTWMQGEKELRNSSRVTIYERVNVTGDGRVVMIKSYLELSGLAAADHGMYSCTVEDTESGERDSVTVTFQVHILTAPATVLVSSTSEVLDANTTIHVLCVGFGLPQPGITWLRNGRPLTNDTPHTTIHDDVIVRHGCRLASSMLSLQLCGVDGGMIGEYTCIVSNGITSSDHTFSLLAPTAAEFVSGPGQTNHLVLGRDGNYTCDFTGYPYPDITWTRNTSTVPITDTGRFNIHTYQLVDRGLQLTRSVLEITTAVENIEGMFMCSGRNNLTNVTGHTFSKNFIVDVAIPPQILLAPVRYSQMVVSPTGRKTAIVACAAFGSPRPSLSWLNSGFYLSNSSQITITEKVEMHRGKEIVRSQLEICGPETIPVTEYECQAINRYGSTIARNKSSFHLCTLDEVEMMVVPGDQTVAKGHSIFLPCVATIVGGSLNLSTSIKWTRRKPNRQATRGKGEELTNATDRVSVFFEEEERASGVVVVRSILQLGCMQFEDEGIYSCHVENAAINKTAEFDIDVKAVLVNTEGIGTGESVDLLDHAGYIGPIVTNTILLAIIVCYLVFEDLRKSKIGVPLLNLCSALVALNFAYIVSFVSAFRSWTSVGGCGFLAALFHYLFLTAGFAFAVVVTFVLTDRKDWLPKRKSLFYAVVFLINWGLPLLIVVLSAAPNPSNYNSGLMTFCGPRNWSLWLGIGLPVILAHVMSASALILLPCVSDKVHGYVKQRELLGLVITLLLFDVIWGVGLSSFVLSVDNPQRETLQNVFIITSAVQGPEILFFFCLLSRRFRLQFVKIFSRGTGQERSARGGKNIQCDPKEIECPENVSILQRKLSGVSTGSLSPGVNGERSYTAAFRPLALEPINEQTSTA